MDDRHLDAVLKGLPPAEAAEIREFAGRTIEEQVIYLFREVKMLKVQPPFPLMVRNLGPLGAVLAYAVIDQQWWRHLLK